MTTAAADMFAILTGIEQTDDAKRAHEIARDMIVAGLSYLEAHKGPLYAAEYADQMAQACAERVIKAGKGVRLP